ncbi:MocR-like pyridoxine biosynthesis transcription factor PdxR [Desmospora profundinema]|uniref:GntR family transcriptional regulator/MocR family aminotransferase n=1 Tax=Desmospora profundinema TaxID=1571184 RepID=A0ABU1IQ06_9BACL|nr:PLP-dependent aminotransferase family protein [Desmospora profundinema]MDR6226019.1 GntR family transcriptional regulator/MocR family aminotransferase [Desmospora profundinema]
MLWLHIDRSLDISLKKQVYEQIRTRILQGELTAGYRLPASRELAIQLNLSRNVVIEAYEQLLAEGYVKGRQGSGTYVAPGAYLERDLKEQPSSFLETHRDEEKEKDEIDFRSGIPALNHFPKKKWGKLSKQVCEEASNADFGYDNPEGRSEFRHVLSRYLKRTRGVHCHPDQLIITSGATQGFSLIANLLLSPDDRVIIEDPITHEIQTIFSSSGATLYPVPVDEDGMRTDLIPVDKKPGFVFVTSSHQFPLGGILPIQRRIQLIQLARKLDTYIVEDDYDSEFRYDGEPIHSLQGLDPERVVYVGTFSKILSPSLRLGYLILPPVLTQQCRELKWFFDLHAPSLEQMTLSRFIHNGSLDHHIQKMRKLYVKRRKILKVCLKEEFGDRVSISGDSTGLHLIVEFKDVQFDEGMLSHISRYKVKVYPVELHSIQKGFHRKKLILGYGNLNEEQIREGICRLGQALHRL